MTALTLSTAGATTLRADALVVGVGKGAKGPVLAPGAEAVDKAFDGKLATVLEALGAAGAEGEVTKLPAPAGLKVPVVIAAGLGSVPEKDETYGAEALRRAAGSAARALSGAKKAGFALPIASAEDAEAIAEARSSVRTPSPRTRAARTSWRRRTRTATARSCRSARSPCSAPSRATRRSRRPPSVPSQSSRRSTAPAT